MWRFVEILRFRALTFPALLKVRAAVSDAVPIERRRADAALSFSDVALLVPKGGTAMGFPKCDWNREQFGPFLALLADLLFGPFEHVLGILKRLPGQFAVMLPKPCRERRSGEIVHDSIHDRLQFLSKIRNLAQPRELQAVQTGL